MNVSHQKQYIVASVYEWNRTNFDKFSDLFPGKWFYVESPDQLTEALQDIIPTYIFFPHWRWIVPDNIINKYECICFHMTDVPYGRGGSPLQNLIVRGYKDTVLTALKMGEVLDAGPVYIKKSLSLDGRAEEIYKRTSLLTWDIIKEIVEKEPITVQQEGEPVIFKRRQPEESLLPEDLDLEQVYDYIRMLDAPGYPKAFLQFGNFRLEFERADLSDSGLTAKVKFIKKSKEF